MSIQKTIIIIVVIQIVFLSFLVFINKKKYANDMINVCANKKCFLSMLVINISLFWLLNLVREKYQLNIPHLIIIIMMYYLSLVFFLLLKVTYNFFDTRCLITNEPSLLGSLTQYLIALLTPFLTYIYVIKFDGNLFMFFIYCLINTALSMALGIKLIKIKIKL